MNIPAKVIIGTFVISISLITMPRKRLISGMSVSSVRLFKPHDAILA